MFNSWCYFCAFFTLQTFVMYGQVDKFFDVGQVGVDIAQPFCVLKQT